MENGFAINGKSHFGDTMAVEDGNSHPKVGDRGVQGFHESKDSEGEVFEEAPEEIHTHESPVELGGEQIINGEVHVDKAGDSDSLGINGTSNGDHEAENFEEAIELPGNEFNKNDDEVGVVPGNEFNKNDDEVGVAHGVVYVEDKAEEIVPVEISVLDNVGSVRNVEAVVNLGNDQTQEGEHHVAVEKMTKGLVSMELVDEISLGDENVTVEHNDKEVVLVESNSFDGGTLVGNSEVEFGEFSDIVADRDIEPLINGTQVEGRSDAVPEKFENGDLAYVGLGESPVVHEKAEIVNVEQVESDVIEASRGNEPDELTVHPDTESAELKEPSANPDGEHQDQQNAQLKYSSTELDPSLKETGIPEVEIPLSAEYDIVRGKSDAVPEKSENGDLAEVSLGELPVVYEKAEVMNVEQVDSDVTESSRRNESDELIVLQDGESAELKEPSANLNGEHQDHQSLQLNYAIEQDPLLKETGTPKVEILLSAEESDTVKGKSNAVPEISEVGDLADVSLEESPPVHEKAEVVNVEQVESDMIEPSQGNEPDEVIVHEDYESVKSKEPSANPDGEHHIHQNVQFKISSTERDPSIKEIGIPEGVIPPSAEESDTVKADVVEPEAKALQDSRPLLVNRNVREGSSSHIKVKEPAVQETQKVENRGPNGGSSGGNSTNPPLPSQTRPAGLGGAPLLGAAERALQQPRANGSMPRRQAQLVEDPKNGEAEENEDEAREKLQMIRVKFLRLAHRLGQTPHNVVVAQVLYRLGLAEQLQGGNTTRAGAFSFDRASAMAEQLEAAGQEPLEFSCTIMVIGKTGVGKSATINSIFDEVKFSTDAFNAGTKKVQDVVGTVQGIKVRVIDTPGLLSSWSDQRQNEKILHSVKRFIKKTPPDIVLYLDRLDMQSRDFGDMPLLRTITEIFGPSIWFNAIVVLTHAASAPPDGPNGTASSYEMFVTQRSQMVQQAIRQAAGDMRLMNPVSLVENHSACRTNRAGQRVLPNGQVWKPHLLLLSFASKILAEANTLLKLQDSPQPFATRSRAPPLPFLLSSLLQSRPQLKLPEEQFGSDEDALVEDLDEASDLDEDSDYDELPPFKHLTKAQLGKLSKAQKKAYFDELEYREKLFMKKQLKEERKRRKLLKKMADMAKDLPNEYNESAEEESGGAASVPVPMPDLALPTSFDSDNPTHRYRFLDSSNQWLVRPVLDTHGWDHDVGYEGINVERLFVIKDKVPFSFSGQVTKDKKEANAQMELAGSVKHGEGKATSLGLDVQTVGKDMAYTLRSETRFSNFRHNKTAAGLSVTLLGDALSAGVKVEDKLIVNKQFRLVLTGGAMTGRGDVAYGGSLEATLRDKDYPLGRMLSTLGLSIMDWHGDLAIGCNVQSQLPLGRFSNMIARANLNNRGSGQVSIRLNSSEQLQIALIGLIPLFRKLVGYSQQMHFGQ